MPRQVGGDDARGRGRRHVVGRGAVEADGVDGRGVEGRGADKGDVGAGVEELVEGVVEVGGVSDLEGGVGAFGDGGGGRREGEAGVTGVEFADGGRQGGEVGLGTGVWAGGC